MLRLTALVCLLAAASFANAQESGRTYQVEVVVFEQSGGTAERLVLPREAAQAPADGPRTRQPESLGGPRATGQLAGVARRLSSGGYRVLWHQAWTQKANSRQDDRPVPLPVLAALGGGPAAARLNGTIELSAGRYLHLGLDLSAPGEGEAEYTLSQERRVKLNELNYFDHPRLGAVTLVTLPDAGSGGTGAP